jgi:hypothetical protein
MLTKHAHIRSQQRSISPLMIDLLLQLGTTEKTFGGATKVFFDKVSRRRVYAYAGPLASLIEQHLDIYAVVGDDCQIITVGHRNERIRRH